MVLYHEIEPYIIKLEKRKRLKRVIINTKVEESAARMNIPKRLYIVIRIYRLVLLNNSVINYCFLVPSTVYYCNSTSARSTSGTAEIVWVLYCLDFL